MSSKKNVEKKKNEKEETKKKPKKEEQRKKKEFPLPPQPKNFKQIEYNEETGKLFLIDYNNDIFECNIFGEKIPQFHINITGTSNYSKRLKNNFIEELKLEPDVYFPKINKFEGYFPYPRPLSLPFINEVKNPKMMINEIKRENRYNNKKIKKILELKIPSQDNKCILSYMTTDLGNENNNVILHLITLINNYIEEKKKENPFNDNFINTDHSIIALKRFRGILKLNLKKNEINGKKFPYPKKEIKTKYNLIRNLIRKQGWKKMHKINENVNFDIYRELYKVKRVGSEEYIFKPKNLSKLGNLKNCENIYELIRSRTQKKYSPNKTEYTIISDNTLSNQNQTKTTGFDIKFQTARTNFFPNKTDTNFDLNTTELEKENLSILSEEDLLKKEEKKFYKTFTEFKNETENGNRLLKGFQYPEYKESPLYLNKFKPSLKNPGEIYLKEIELLRKVNPIAFKKEELRDQFNLKMLQKKKQNKLIYERIKIKKD